MPVIIRLFILFPPYHFPLFHCLFGTQLRTTVQILKYLKYTVKKGFEKIYIYMKFEVL
uniref:Uncharacterized protein n=1 Tax=Arundo donax TaxID=35708 RepID=A0A0A8YP63_ARUDO